MDDAVADVASSISVEDATAAMDLSEETKPTTTDSINTSPAEDHLHPTDPMIDTEPIDTSSTDDEGDDDDDLHLDDDKNDEMGISPEKADLILIKATGLKEEGNQEFKEGKIDQAARSYRRGVSALKKLNRNNTGEEQVQALLVTLHTNLSTVLFKQNKYRVSVGAAAQAIHIAPEHCVKALYRRAVAYRKLGEMEKARDDLRRALQQDPMNIACKKELISCRKEIEIATQNQKKALSKAFATGGGGLLYNDKEDAAKRRAEEEQRKKQQEEELLQKRKVEWEDECVKLMARNESAISFEEWDKQRIEREKAEQKEREAIEKRKRHEARQAKREAKKVESENNTEGDEDELTEAELAMFRGYKKTADGRTTSYFTRELSEEEKKRIGDTAPKLLNQGHSGDDRINNETSQSTNPLLNRASGSVWNRAGTWEERDTTAWATNRLRQRLQESSTTLVGNTLTVHSTKVEDLTGDASVAIVSGKKRYIFDFHVKIEYEVRNKDGTVVGKGVARLPDICSTHHEEIAIDFDGWVQRPHADQLSAAMSARETFAELLRSNVQLFVHDFNSTY